MALNEMGGLHRVQDGTVFHNLVLLWLNRALPSLSIA